MARSVGVSVENNFVNGLVTEATGLNFPENAVTETQNCVFDDNGVVSRRKGINFEQDFTNINLTSTGVAYTEYVWQSVAGNGNTTFYIQQIGTQVFIFRLDGDGIVSRSLIGQIDMNEHSLVDEDTLKEIPFQYSSGNGNLFIVGRYTHPIFVKHIIGTTFTVDRINIRTRDFIGLLGDVEFRPPNLSTIHFYNLKNQGWDPGRIGLFYSGSTVNFTPTEGLGLYPSNYDVWWLYKNAQGEFQPNLANLVDRGTSAAPKGRIILDEFYKDRSGVADLGGIAVESSGTERPSAVAFFAGRVFYSGVNKEGWISKIYFSNIIQSEEDYGKCYQKYDPTSEIAADLLPDDGGVITIPDAGTIYRLWSLDAALMVFASNGIWQITGSSGIGFTANDYTVKKISNIRCLSGLSFVDVGGVPLWWSEEGIHAVALNSAVGSTSIQTISDKKIKSLLDEITTDLKRYVKGAYNPNSKIVQWLYRTTPQIQNDNYSYDRILCLNTISGAFYTWTVDATETHLKGIGCISGGGSTFSEELVFDQDNEVVTVLDDESEPVDVTVNSTLESTAIQATFKYTVCVDTTYEQTTFAEEYDLNYIDWFDGDAPHLFESYFVSGYRLRGEAQRKFQSNYCTVFSDNTNPSAYFFQGIWDYSTSGNTGRWGSRQKIDFTASDYAYQKRRLKIRGHGIALQYRIESVANRPFDIIGWSVFESVNGGP
jgi:hypothetical protein